MKKKMGAAVFLLITVLLFAGCGKQNHGLDPDNPVTITIWHYYNGTQLAAFDTLVADFNETVGREKGIVVEAYSHGGVNQLIEAVEASAKKEVGAEELPNIFTGYTDLVYGLDDRGLIAPLDEYFTEEELEEYVSGFLDEGRFDKEGRLKVCPTAKSTELLFLNKTDWERFAEETGASYEELLTWEGLARTAEKYYEWTDAKTEEPEDGKAFFGRDSYANFIFIGCKQLGKELCNVENGKAELNLDQDVMRRIWDNFYIPYINGYYTASGRFRSDDAKTGEVIALVGSSTSASYFPTQVEVDETTFYDIEGEVLPLPNFEGEESLAVQQGAGMAVTVSEEKKEYASAVFLKWFTEKEQNLEFAVTSGYLPVKKESNQLEALEEFLQESELQLLSTEGAALRTAMKQVNEYQLFTTRPFQNGNNFRNVLEAALIDKAKADREMVTAEIRSGKSREEAVRNYATDENFIQWYENFEHELAELLK